MKSPLIYQKKPSGYKSSSQRDKELEYEYYSKRVYTDLSIKLNRQHTPIHKSMCLNTQLDYDFYIAVLNYLHNQLDFGFEPYWFISLHYQHPVEHALNHSKKLINHWGLVTGLTLKPNGISGMKQHCTTTGTNKETTKTK